MSLNQNFNHVNKSLLNSNQPILVLKSDRSGCNPSLDKHQQQCRLVKTHLHWEHVLPDLAVCLDPSEQRLSKAWDLEECEHQLVEQNHLVKHQPSAQSRRLLVRQLRSLCRSLSSARHVCHSNHRLQLYNQPRNYLLRKSLYQLVWLRSVLHLVKTERLAQAMTKPELHAVTFQKQRKKRSLKQNLQQCVLSQEQ